jgi:hypothetical protein
LHFGRASAIGMLLVGMACAGAVAEEAVRLQRVASTGEAAPGGGVFDRFGAEAAPIVAPVNARGDVAFFATLGRGNSGRRSVQVVARARGGRRARRRPGGLGRYLLWFRPAPGTGARRRRHGGVRCRDRRRPRRRGPVRRTQRQCPPVALAGAQAPGNAGVLAAFDAPAINARGDIVFLAGLRRGRETSRRS